MRKSIILENTCLIIFLISTFYACKPDAGNARKTTGQTFANMDAGVKNGQLMDEDEFWEIIDQSRDGSGDNYLEQVTTLKSILMKREPEEIEKFNNTFVGLMSNSYDNRLWAASYIINGGCSDDCFEYFRQYLVAHGKLKFYETLNDPESCAGWVKSEGEAGWEGLMCAANEAYMEKTGKEIPLTFEIDYVLKGKSFNEDSLGLLYPALAAKFLK